MYFVVEAISSTFVLLETGFIECRIELISVGIDSAFEFVEDSVETWTVVFSDSEIPDIGMLRVLVEAESILAKSEFDIFCVTNDGLVVSLDASKYVVLCLLTASGDSELSLLTVCDEAGEVVSTALSF